MKRQVGLVLVVLAMMFNAGLVQAQDGLDRQAVAQAVIDHMVAREFEAATQDFTPDMAAALTADQLEQTWDALEAQIGAFQQQVSMTEQTIDDYAVFVFTLQFEKALMDAQLSITSDGQVGGFYIRASQTTPPPAYEPPDYVVLESFEEQDITLGAGTDWELPGTLTLPVGDGPFPAVVLVQGSGPNDRDETIGPNKPFRDLAWGLASQGIAVLRYDKRTLVYGADIPFDTLTVREETLDDAVLAVDLLRNNPAIDPDRVVVIGHSLGGYLAPRIAQSAPELAGIVILAGNTRPLEDLIVEQVTYIAELDGSISTEEQQQIDALETLVSAIKALDSPDTPGDFLNAPAAYWMDLQSYDPVQMAQSLDLPILILQGERDYQVTMTDFHLWQAGLADHENVTFTSYPDLNHLMMSGTGPSSPAEYQEVNHVSDRVITDLAHWILGL